MSGLPMLPTPFGASRSTDNSPLSASSQLSPDSFKTNIHRNKTKRWVEAPKADYGGGGWGDEDDDEDNNGNGKPPPPPQKEYLETTSNAAAGHGATPRGGPLLRQNSFERGDDDTVIPPMDHVTSRRFPPILGDSDHHDKGLPHGQPQQEQLPAHHTQQINVDPPIPRNQSVFRVPVIKRMETAGTDESELEPYQQPHQSGITSRELAVSPVVDVSPPLQELRDRFAEPSLTPKHTLYEDSSRIPLALVAPGVDSTPVPLQVFTATADLQNFGSLLALEDNVKAPNYGNIDKPTPPLPPPEDTSLETISEHGSPVLSPRQEPRPSRKWDKTPSYDDYEDGYYDDNTISHVSPSQPLYSSLLPSIQPDPPAFILPHEAMATHKQKILRPADIYKRHQEELSLRSGEDSARFSADPTMRPCIDASGPLTSEPERIRSHQSSNPVNSQPSRRESSEELSGSSESTSRLSSKQGSDQGGDFSRSRSRSGGRAFAVPLSQNTPTLDSLPSIPLGSLDPKISPDIISGYSISPTDTDGKLDYFASTADPKLAYHQADNDSAEKTSRESRFGGIEDIEGNALIHNPPTAATQGATSSPLSPDKHPEISSLQECLLAPLVSGLALGTINQTDGQTLPPGELQGGVTNLSTPKVVPPLNQAVACHSDENPSTIIHSGVRSLDKDDLDTFIVELERAQTPDLRPSDTPKQQPSIGDLRDENTSLYAPRSPYTTLESTGAPPVYYQEDDETQYIQSSLYTQTVHPRPHIQGVPVSVGEHKGEIKPVDYSHGGSGPLGRPPSPKPMEIPVSMRASENPEEPATPASSVDDELLDMISAGRRFLDRRTTEPSAVSLEDRNNGDVDKPQTPTIKGNKMIAKSAIDVDFDSIQATSPTRSLGPESEGIEVINGPTVERRQTTAESQNTSTENEYANELVNQFCRPQTLVLKDTVPMPAGTLLMPPMPPLSGMADSEAVPEVVNFDKDDADCLEPLSHVAPGLELAHHQRGFELLPTLPPPPPHDHQDRLQTAHTTTTTAIFEDINTITTIKNSLERTQAYDALRHKIMNAPNPLLEWTVHQIQQNNGNALLCTELVKIRPGHSLKKSKIDMGRADHQDDGTAHRAEEKLERMGRGAMKLGEKAGGKVGSWMKRVGKKGHGSKESENGGLYLVAGGTSYKSSRDSDLSLVGIHRPSEPTSSREHSTSSSTLTMRHGESTSITPSSGRSPTQHVSQLQLPLQPVQPPPQDSLCYYPTAPQRLSNIQTQPLPIPAAAAPNPPQPDTPLHSSNSGEETRQQTPTQYYRTVLGQGSQQSAPDLHSTAIYPAGEELSNPITRLDHHPGSQDSVTNGTIPSPPLGKFLQRGGSLQNAKAVARQEYARLGQEHETIDNALYLGLKKPNPNLTSQTQSEFHEPHEPHLEKPTPEPDSLQFEPHGGQIGLGRNQALIPNLHLLAETSVRDDKLPQPPRHPSIPPTVGSRNRPLQQIPHLHVRAQSDLLVSQQDSPVFNTSRQKSNNVGKPPGSSSSSDKKVKGKRASFLGNISSKLDSMGRSGSISKSHSVGDASSVSPPPPPKVLKRGSLLTKFGQKQKRLDEEKSKMSHKKGVSDMFGRSASTNAIFGSKGSRKLAGAGLAGGGSGGAQDLVQPKIYNTQTGQYSTYEQSNQRSIGSRGQLPRSDIGHYPQTDNQGSVVSGQQKMPQYHHYDPRSIRNQSEHVGAGPSISTQPLYYPPPQLAVQHLTPHQISPFASTQSQYPPNIPFPEHQQTHPAQHIPPQNSGYAYNGIAPGILSRSSSNTSPSLQEPAVHTSPQEYKKHSRQQGSRIPIAESHQKRTYPVPHKQPDIPAILPISSGYKPSTPSQAPQLPPIPKFDTPLGKGLADGVDAALSNDMAKLDAPSSSTTEILQHRSCTNAGSVSGGSDPGIFSSAPGKESVQIQNFPLLPAPENPRNNGGGRGLTDTSQHHDFNQPAPELESLNTPQLSPTPPATQLVGAVLKSSISQHGKETPTQSGPSKLLEGAVTTRKNTITHDISPVPYQVDLCLDKDRQRSTDCILLPEMKAGGASGPGGVDTTEKFAGNHSGKIIAAAGATEAEEKIAVLHELEVEGGGGENEFFSEEGPGKEETVAEERDYVMSSTAYPGQWEPEYLGWSYN